VVDKRQIRQTIKGLQRVKTWQLFIVFILAVFVAATFLRLNNIGMVERRNSVIDADDAGQATNTVNRLYDLQRYVSSHMNTDMGKGVYLESSYKRGYQAAIDAAASDNNPNGNIYKKAQEVCAPQFTRYSYAYLQCTTGELAKYPAASDPASSVKEQPPNTYLHAYVSPLWSPDFAGWSVLVCLALVVMIVARITAILVLRAMLHRHNTNI
jgi:hypothetical protein